MARFLASLIAATLSFSLLNSGTQGRPAPTTTPSAAEPFILSNPLLLQDDGPPRTTTTPATPPLPSQALASAPVAPASTVPLAGKTIDLTLFALVRALDTLLSLHASTRPVNPPTRLPRLTVPLLFAASSATIMHAYFYASSRLPRSYQSWLTRFAQVDARLLLALRHARTGRFRYGADTGLAPLLGSLCAELGLPEAWGDPATTIPVPCRLVHQGVRGGCEANALARGGRAWALAMRRIYLPLQALALLRRLLRRARAGPGAARGLRDAARGAAFLAAFVALFWYGVCLARTRAGPRLFGRRMVTPQMWDGGLCVAAGCALCGWSVLVEERRRRAELLLFVLPRAAAVWGPRAYDRKVSLAGASLVVRSISPSGLPGRGMGVALLRLRGSTRADLRCAVSVEGAARVCAQHGRHLHDCAGAAGARQRRVRLGPGKRPEASMRRFGEPIARPRAASSEEHTRGCRGVRGLYNSTSYTLMLVPCGMEDACGWREQMQPLARHTFVWSRFPLPRESTGG